MNKDELHKLIETEQPNICQVVAYKGGKEVYSDCWGFQPTRFILRSQQKRTSSLQLRRLRKRRCGLATDRILERRGMGFVCLPRTWQKLVLCV